MVDTLNLVHWLRAARIRSDLGLPPTQLTLDTIVRTIDCTADELKRRHTGRVIYVLKDRESQFNDEAARLALSQAAERNSVYVCVAERYEDPPSGAPHSKEHSASGRDDFFMATLAQKYRCAVLTADRLKDFDRFRATLQPFHVYEYAFWRATPDRTFVRPDAQAWARLKKPPTSLPHEYFDKSIEICEL